MPTSRILIGHPVPSLEPRSCIYAMCQPTYFDVVYSVNPFMDPSIPTSKTRAMAQWDSLRKTLVGLGHQVHQIDPLIDQPDMVFMANSAVLIGNRGMSARFKHPFRAPETIAYHDWLESLGFDMRRPQFVSEGEGDFVVMPTVGREPRTVFAGRGVRTEVGAYQELADFLEVEVIPLQLIDERFYHLDTALSIIDNDTAIVVPSAFDSTALKCLYGRFTNLLEVPIAEALLLGANAISDGAHVIHEAGATDLKLQLEALGYSSIPLPFDEFRKSGGSARCCVLEFY